MSKNSYPNATVPIDVPVEMLDMVLDALALERNVQLMSSNPAGVQAFRDMLAELDHLKSPISEEFRSADWMKMVSLIVDGGDYEVEKVEDRSYDRVAVKISEQTFVSTKLFTRYSFTQNEESAAFCEEVKQGLDNLRAFIRGEKDRI